MLKHLPLVLICSYALTTQAQTQNALDFDGIDDRIFVPNASELIAGSGGVTMSCWFYPRNTAPDFPDFDGIAGFRNENDCDFYLLQLTATSLEARIRFGAFDVYSLEGSGIQVNAWNHAALVHDGSTLSLYVNGALAASTAAPGALVNTTSTFQIGNLTYDINEFSLDGRADEVGLWKRALSIEEIQCLMNGSADLTDPDLVLYYGCDQGTPGGDNTSITTLTDGADNINGLFNGFALMGAGSNFVEGAGFGTSFNADVCPGATYLYDGQVLTAGTYTYNFIGQSGCDSVVTVTVNETPVNVSVNATATMLTSLNGSASWQWLDCDNGFTEIAGATFQTFDPTANGSYGVEVTDNGCVDTSFCYDITSIGLEEWLAPLGARLVPTVTEGPLRVLLDDPQGLVAITITDAVGRKILRSQATAKPEQWLDVSHLKSGSYQLKVTVGERCRTLRFVRE